MGREIMEVVLDTLREVAEEHAIELPVEVDEATVLFGRSGVLDSMALVSLVVAVEQAIEDEIGVAVALADERALSQAASPYRSVGALAGYAAARVAEASADG